MESNKLHNIFKIMEQEENFPLLDDLEIHYLELPKLLSKEVKELNKIELWLEFLQKAGREGNEERLKNFMERSETMKTAINKLQEISADEKMRELYLAREKARLDMVSKLKYARREGKEEGREEEREELAKNLLLDGMEVELVAKYTKLTKAKVEAIKKKS